MKRQALLLVAAFFVTGNVASAQVSTTGDPAASSQNSKKDTTGMSATKSGSGTSTSGGKDDNGDQGRDKMPESNMDVKAAPGKPSITKPGSK